MGNRTVNVTTRVELPVKRRLDRVCKKYGFASSYDMFRAALLAFLQAADPEGEGDGGNEDGAVYALADAFGRFDEMHGAAFGSRRPVKTLREVYAVFGVRGRKRPELRRITPHSGGGYDIESGDAALLRIVALADPTLSRDLLRLARKRGGGKCLGELRRVAAVCVDEMHRQDDGEELAAEFGKLADHEAPAYGERTRRVKARGVDDVEGGR